MKQRPRRYFTDSEMALVWDRWQKVSISPRSLLHHRSTSMRGALAVTCVQQFKLYDLSP